MIFKANSLYKLGESLSPVTKKLDEVRETTQKLRELIEKTQPKNNIAQLTIEHAPHHQPIENNEGVMFDTELENTLKIMRSNTGFFQIYEDPENRWLWNGYPVKRLGGTEVEINDKTYNITPGIQKVSVIISYNSAKSMNDKDKKVYRDMSQRVN